MQVAHYFQDTEGAWTAEKKEHVSAIIMDRCRAKDWTGEITIDYKEPVVLPIRSGATVFQYHALADIPDAS